MLYKRKQSHMYKSNIIVIMETIFVNFLTFMPTNSQLYVLYSLKITFWNLCSSINAFFFNIKLSMITITNSNSIRVLTVDVMQGHKINV